MPKPTVWNPYAEAYDLALTEVELEEADAAARRLDSVIARLPSWVVEELKLTEGVERLRNATLEGGES